MQVMRPAADLLQKFLDGTNGAKKTTYVAVVKATATTKADTTNNKSVN